MPDRDRSDIRNRALIGAGVATAAAAAGVGALFLWGRRHGDGPIVGAAPPHVLRGKASDERQPVGRTVTIGRPRDEIYAAWRDFTRFPAFMDNVETVEDLGDGRSRWSIKAPLGTDVELVTRITEDRPGEAIAWASEPESDIDTDGRIEFADAPPGRGTHVRLLIRYDPPAGMVGKVLAKVLQREPAIQARRDLRRFKQLMETGEISTTASPSGRASETPTMDRI